MLHNIQVEIGPALKVRTLSELSLDKNELNEGPLYNDWTFRYEIINVRTAMANQTPLLPCNNADVKLC